MEFPESCHLGRATTVLEIFKCHSKRLRRQRLRQIPTVLGVEAKSVLCQLRLNIPACAAIFAIDWCFHHHPGRVLIRGLRNLQVDVAITRVEARILEECLRNMEQLEFAPGPWGIRWNEHVLRPAQDGINRNFLWHRVGKRHVLCNVPVIGNVWQKRYAVTDIVLRTADAAGQSDNRECSQAGREVNPSQ